MVTTATATAAEQLLYIEQERRKLGDEAARLREQTSKAPNLKTTDFVKRRADLDRLEAIESQVAELADEAARLQQLAAAERRAAGERQSALDERSRLLAALAAAPTHPIVTRSDWDWTAEPTHGADVVRDADRYLGYLIRRARAARAYLAEQGAAVPPPIVIEL